MPPAEQPLAGRLNLRFEGTGTTAAPRGNGTLTVTDAVWQETVLGRSMPPWNWRDRPRELRRARRSSTPRPPPLTIDTPYNAAVTGSRTTRSRAGAGDRTPDARVCTTVSCFGLTARSRLAYRFCHARYHCARCHGWQPRPPAGRAGEGAIRARARRSSTAGGEPAKRVCRQPASWMR